MQEIKNLRGITDFNLYFAEYITDEGVAAIKDWKRLKRLNLHGTKAGDTALEHIAGTHLARIAGCRLHLNDRRRPGTAHQPDEPQKSLTMGGNELGDAGMQALRQMPNLTYLDLSGRQGNDKNVWSIAMSNTGLQAVLTLKNLHELRFACVSTSVGIEGAKLGEVSTLSVTEKWLEQIKSLTNLERLKVQGCGRINDEAVAVLIAMPCAARSGFERHRGHGKRQRTCCAPPNQAPWSTSGRGKAKLLPTATIERWSIDCQLDRFANTAGHFHLCIDGKLRRFLVHHVGNTRA